MSATDRADPAVSPLAGASVVGFTLNVFPQRGRCVVRVCGEVDLAARDQLVASCTAGDHPEMVVDLAGVTFMDCGGYGSLVASRLAVQASGRTLTVRGQSGQPARLFDLIAGLDIAGL